MLPSNTYSFNKTSKSFYPSPKQSLYISSEDTYNQNISSYLEPFEGSYEFKRQFREYEKLNDLNTRTLTEMNNSPLEKKIIKNSSKEKKDKFKHQLRKVSKYSNISHLSILNKDNEPKNIRINTRHNKASKYINCPALEHYKPIKKYYISGLNRISGYLNQKYLVNSSKNNQYKIVYERELSKREKLLKNDKIEFDKFANFSSKE